MIHNSHGLLKKKRIRHARLSAAHTARRAINASCYGVSIEGHDKIMRLEQRLASPRTIAMKSEESKPLTQEDKCQRQRVLRAEIRRYEWISSVVSLTGGIICSRFRDDFCQPKHPCKIFLPLRAREQSRAVVASKSGRRRYRRDCVSQSNAFTDIEKLIARVFCNSWLSSTSG